MMAEDERVYEKFHKGIPKYPESFMVAGVISRNTDININ